MNEKPLRVGEMGVLQHLHRSVLNGLIAEVTGELKKRMLYSLSNPADSEICPAYRIHVPGHPAAGERIEWCVKSHQIRRIADPDDIEEKQASCGHKEEVSMDKCETEV